MYILLIFKQCQLAGLSASLNMPFPLSLLSMVEHNFLLLQTALELISLCPRSAGPKETQPVGSNWGHLQPCWPRVPRALGSAESRAHFIYVQEKGGKKKWLESWPGRFGLAIEKCFCAIRSHVDSWDKLCSLD